MSKVLIIAEAGINHNGDMELASRMVAEAAAAGADCIKFQTFTAEKVLSAATPKAQYQKRTTGTDESMLDLARRLELSFDNFRDLAALCQQHTIGFLSTPFDHESIDFLVSLGLDTIKIPSGELTNLPYLRKIGGLARKLIISTGMANLGEIESALNVLQQAGSHRRQMTVLHCSTEYPTPMPEVNLKAMLTIRDAFKVKVGYSDHTLGIEIPIAAAALGASVIEKHFTLDKNMEGPDHPASLEPGELKAMVTAIRHVEQGLGNGIKKAAPSEAKNMDIARRSIVAACDICQGETFSETNITTKRPGNGISPMLWDSVLGRKAKRAFARDQLIEL